MDDLSPGVVLEKIMIRKLSILKYSPYLSEWLPSISLAECSRRFVSQWSIIDRIELLGRGAGLMGSFVRCQEDLCQQSFDFTSY